jgi:wyosine [tRNA(Phe)-imidazoG37] synthetase (radical SAM superfamily)
MKRYRYIYGPVSSWRLGCSLGIDPISGELKVCTFDCTYCQAGRTKPYSGKRRVFIPTSKIINEIKSLGKLKIDYITFSGAGEPTLAKNLGQLIRSVKKIRSEKIAVLTNSSLIAAKDVQRDLKLADFVIAKLDAPSAKIFRKINCPLKNLQFEDMIRGIKDFGHSYKGRFAIQVMFTGENISCAEGIATIVKDIGPDEVQINTPLRPCRIKPLSKICIEQLRHYFKGCKVISCYDKKRKKTKPLNREDTLRRRASAD